MRSVIRVWTKFCGDITGRQTKLQALRVRLSGSLGSGRIRSELYTPYDVGQLILVCRVLSAPVLTRPQDQGNNWNLQHDTSSESYATRYLSNVLFPILSQCTNRQAVFSYLI